MSFTVVPFSVLIALVGSMTVSVKDTINLEYNIAYGYLTKVGLPLAIKIREYETRSNTYNIPDLETHEAIAPAIRIVDGTVARLGDIPYQAGILVDYEKGHSVCGGSLINSKMVLSAAHCWWDGEHQAKSLTIVLGSVKLYEGGLRLDTTKVTAHSQYDPKKYRNDIAMIHLPEAVKFSDTVKPIALPSGNMLRQSFSGETVIASGFGYTKDGDVLDYSTSLSHVKLQVIKKSVCRRTYLTVSPSIICTKGVNPKNICGGDSGGPLTITRNDTRILVGITAFGSNRSCEDGAPAAFTRVTYFMDWINDLL